MSKNKSNKNKIAEREECGRCGQNHPGVKCIPQSVDGYTIDRISKF